MSSSLAEIIQKRTIPLAPIATDFPEKMPRLEGIKAVLFDIYGTLFISGSGDVGTAAATDTAEALTASLEASGFGGDLIQAGRNGKVLLKQEILAWHERARAAGADYPEVEIAEIWETILSQLSQEGLLKFKPIERKQVEQVALEYECGVNPVYPMPQALETLNALQKSGMPLGIVSNAQFYTPPMFEAHFNQTVEQLGFDAELCLWSFKELISKPSTRLFPKVSQTLRQKYGIEPHETVYVGNDMLNDMMCAQRDGLKTVLFAGDKRSLRLREEDDRCTGVVPDAVITSLDQLLQII